MTGVLSRTFAGLLLGALGGIAALAAAYARHPAIVMEMDGPVPAISGLYDVERSGQETYAWTRQDAALVLPGLDRRVPWSCTIRVKGGRENVTTLPQVLLSVDGVIGASLQTTNEYQDVSVTLPPRDGARRTIVTLTSSNTFQPGASDPRALGVMIDRWTCAPEGTAVVWPPQRALVAAAAAGATFGAALALAGLTLVAIVLGCVAISGFQAVPLAWQFAMFTPYIDRVGWLAFWIAAALVAAIRASEWWLGRRLHKAARFVAVFTAAVLYLKLLGLLHPSKPLVDAVFHAHRLTWVREGRFFFTQPMPGGVQFPYAIGLYVFALPWTLLTSDNVFLLRVIVSAADASGGVLLYLMLSRVWNDRLAGAIAAVLFSMVPRIFEIVGNANMTNAFGQSVALAAIAAAVLWKLGARGRWQPIAFTALTAFALLCHVSTLALLAAFLFVLAIGYGWRGDREMRTAARWIVAGLVIAGVFSVAVYYGHFGDAFRSAARVRSASPAATEALPPSVEHVGVGSRVLDAATLTVAAVGWPMTILAAIGVLSWWQRGTRNRLSLAVAAWMVTYLTFTASVVLLPVGTSFVRYAAEFITRVMLATSPAFVVLAAIAAASALRRGWAWRLASVALLSAACYEGVSLWTHWFK